MGCYKMAPRLIHNRPGPVAARMPGTGPLRRSSGPARKKAIVDKSRVEANRLQRPAFVFLGQLGGWQFAIML